LKNSVYFFAAYILAFIIAIGFIYFKRRHRRKTRFFTVMKVLFAPRVWLSPSSLLDFKYTLAGILLFPSLFIYTTLSGTWLSARVDAELREHFGALPAAPHAHWLFVSIMALTLYVAYEFAYWLNHYISHKFRFLWEFHKLHHAATTLTPFTLWRVHVMDTIIFSNMVAALVGLAQGVIAYILGQEIAGVALAGANILVYVFLGLYGHLQHSQIWIPFTGSLGHVFFSPAHHQIHHSNNPIHFDKNLGNSLAIFDWAFGTLHMPSHEPERLVYGTDDDAHLRHFVASNLRPFYFSWKHIQSLLPVQGSRLIRQEPDGSR